MISGNRQLPLYLSAPHECSYLPDRQSTTLFADPRGFRMTIDQMLHPYAGQQIDKVVAWLDGWESRRRRAARIMSLRKNPFSRVTPIRGTHPEPA